MVGLPSALPLHFQHGSQAYPCTPPTDTTIQISSSKKTDPNVFTCHIDAPYIAQIKACVPRLPPWLMPRWQKHRPPRALLTALEPSSLQQRPLRSTSWPQTPV